MSESEYTQRELAEFRLKRGRDLHPALCRQLYSMFRFLLPDAESRLEALQVLREWWAENRECLKARKEARNAARKRPRVRLVASNANVVPTEPAMPRDVFRVIVGRPIVVEVETTSKTSHEPEAA